MRGWLDSTRPTLMTARKRRTRHSKKTRAPKTGACRSNSLVSCATADNSIVCFIFHCSACIHPGRAAADDAARHRSRTAVLDSNPHSRISTQKPIFYFFFLRSTTSGASNIGDCPILEADQFCFETDFRSRSIWGQDQFCPSTDFGA